MNNNRQKFTAYISNVTSNGNVDYKFALSDDIEGVARQNFNEEIEKYNQSKPLPDGEYTAMIGRDTLLNPDKTNSINGLANKEGYVDGCVFKIVNGVVSFQ